MLPEFIPNFLATLSHPPWNKALQHNLHMTIEGEKRTPLSSYVQPSSSIIGSSSPTALFPYFNVLPDELQVHILTYCSSSTLFQLMKLSSALRTEASKLCWANTEAYFLVEARWLLDGGYPGYTHSDLAFLAQVQNVEVDYWQGTDDRICPLHEDGTVEVQQDQIKNFWESLGRRCPMAKRVIVNQCWTSLRARKEVHCVPKALQHLIQTHPTGVRASVFIVEEEVDLHAGASVTTSCAEKWQRAVYQLSADSRWEKVKSQQDWDTVLAPAKR
ncbi:hypothetical protein T440DRAFT_27683 [Plenodomus tracheiphilus IPT5]|uniref:F-box domain-containing protein n=1 Tax=Plenodomus tracheiphilus IPT5 TaxID=1408161 RepID=A0A6A7AQB6_9PLEO|nr:hypothetical protein T440DRAFT_27683 [Plenodomus tracheiphilus IPT5]